MNVRVKKYGRWNEDCNWQLEEVKVKYIPDDMYNDREQLEFLGYKYDPKYNEYYLISADKLGMTVFSPQK